MKLALSGLLLLSTLSPVHAQATPDADRRMAHDIFKEFVEAKSATQTGSTTLVTDIALRRLKEAGFPEGDIFVGGPVPNKHNLVVRLHGSGSMKPLLLLAHTDVVEAKREDWNMDPFVLNEKDGYFYGRGVGDDKSQAAIWLETIIRLKREGYKGNRDIIVALTADEEGGKYNGVDWLLKQHPDLLKADFALNEGGWGEMGNKIKASNDLQVSEKYVITYTFKVTNKGGHSSMPVPDNAIYRLADALQKLSKFGFPLKTNEVTAAYFTQMAKIEKGPMAAELAKIPSGDQAAMQKAAAANPNWNSTLRTTCVATMLNGGHAANALPQLAEATVNCRVLPEDSPQYVLETLKKVVDDPEVSILSERESAGGVPSPMRPDVLKAVKQATEKVFPRVPVVPIMVVGATDGRMLRTFGVPTYGVQGFFYNRDDIRFHGRDERLPIKSFYEGQTFMYNLVTLITTP
ncbi:M20/M25/M40 family metallo-hydrolase [Terriglobus roseus]|uniref:Acetylornithine deacetylase/Succinyl-diaminopimelate desuccinylase n=1 Tax=Terriglobus roseus TaxID=392734 RepID=A0A1H4P8R9_9BACT|nr:M20/M25/M40 family metallo-hydrolase [Terriglobus roseus]SEC03820.1 Acetylornithine deacetylase/Succinyl-diaminopimelate desuccinylase [Terriglobus roseus]